MRLPAELANLPKPRVIEETAVDAILARKLALLEALFHERSLPVDTLHTPYEPAVIQVEHSALDEFVLRQRINEAARARLLAFASEDDLDHVAAFYDVTRMLGEPDERLVTRVILAMRGRSTGGTEPRYELIAMSADIRVASAKVYRIGRSPLVYVAVFSSDPNGVADQALLATVSTALQDKAKRMVNDTIIVLAAVRRVVNVAANVWLLPETSLDIFDTMKTSLRGSWAAVQSLGRDFNQAWWGSRLMLDGVHNVEPLAPGDITVQPEEAIAIGDIALNFMGRGI